MATQVKLPRLGQGMDEGKILGWLKSAGDSVEKGEEIYEVETEKVNVEVESPDAGTLLRIDVEEGETVPIGTVIAWIGEEGEDLPEPSAGDGGGDDAAASGNGSGDAASVPAPQPASAPSGASGSSTATAPAPATPAPRPAAPSSASDRDPAGAGNGAAASSGERRLKASPLARRMARERGIELERLQGSGPDGRIVARDLEGVEAAPAAAGVAEPGLATAASSAAEGPGVERVELSSMRRTIARRLGEAWQAPAFYLTRDIDMTATNELRARMVESTGEGDVRPTVSDILTKASAVALRRHRDMNVHWAEDAILKFEDVHVGMAVATEAGLVVPVIRDAHAKTVREIAADRKAIVGKARDGRLGPADMEGGTFTISNLGMMGIDEFTAVLNPPMAGILAVGRTADRAVVIDRRVEVRPIMTVTLGCDHRAVDGAVGARFLATLAEHLEDPTSML